MYINIQGLPLFSLFIGKLANASEMLLQSWSARSNKHALLFTSLEGDTQEETEEVV
jgi:hypothetical protein